MGQQRLGTAGILLKPSMTLFGERAVPGQYVAELGFGYVIELLTGHVGLVEWNQIAIHFEFPRDKLPAESLLALHNAVCVRNPRLMAHHYIGSFEHTKCESFIFSLVSHILSAVVPNQKTRDKTLRGLEAGINS